GSPRRARFTGLERRHAHRVRAPRRPHLRPHGPLAEGEPAMAVELNHTIVPARDPQASARFLADILGLAVDPPLAHFTPVTLANGVSLDFDHHDHVDEHHYAFQLSDDEFDAAFGRIKDQGITHYADPGC